MKMRSILFSLFLILAANCYSAHTQVTVAASSRTAERVPVVLELFTSEGCSSCPPADAFLLKLAEQQPVAGAEVIALEEHVDYWDHQGWNDPFSSAQWTQRQQDYAAGLAEHGVYTPELVVNGRSGFVGSRMAEAYRAITGAIAQPHTEISVSMLKKEDRKHEGLRIEAGKLMGEGQKDAAEVWVAVTEIGLHNSVSGGENAGKDLHHAPVVRWLHKAGNAARDATPSFAGETELKLDSAWKRDNLRIVAFVQEKRSRNILGAAVTRLDE